MLLSKLAKRMRRNRRKTEFRDYGGGQQLPHVRIYKENMDFFVSDYHFDHRNILKYCGRLGMSAEEQEKYNNRVDFKPAEHSAREMGELLIRDTNSVVGKKDRIWCLGDFCYPPREIRERANKCVERFAYWRSRINCENVYLIWGNHDARSWTNVEHLDAEDHKRQLIVQRQIFNGTYDLKTIQIEDQCIVLCHYAIAAWEQMNCKWAPPYWNLYGHSHSTAEHGLDAALPGRRSLDVGVDNIYRLFGNYCPLSFEQIKEIMKDKPGHKIDHHAKIKNKKWLGKTDQEDVLNG